MPAALPPVDDPAPCPGLPPPGQWCLYLIECANGAWYAGITNRLAHRYAAHVAGRGARYTRANRPRRLLGWRPCADRRAAARAEWAIRQLPRDRKLAFLRLPEGLDCSPTDGANPRK